MQVLTSRRKLNRGDVDLRLGNGGKVAALAVGTARLKLQSGEIMELHECHFVPSICQYLHIITDMRSTSSI